MNRMILYKEWLKTRWVLLGIVLVMAAITFYCFLNLTKVVQIRGAEILWETLVSKETVLTEIFRFVPAVAAALLALSQWLPEMQHKRLKLTLHLPYPQGKAQTVHDLGARVKRFALLVVGSASYHYQGRLL